MADRHDLYPWGMAVKLTRDQAEGRRRADERLARVLAGYTRLDQRLILAYLTVQGTGKRVGVR